MAGIYSAAEKIFYALIAWCQPIGDALYPYIAQRRSIKFFKRIFYISNLINIILWFVIFVFSYKIINLIYGKEFYISANLLRLFSMVGVIMFPVILIGYPFIGALGYHNYANYSVIIASLVHICLLLLILPITNGYSVVMVLMISQLLVLLIRFYAVRKYRLWS